MKKIFTVTFFMLAVFSNFALAKTSGSYVGIDLLNSKVKFFEQYTNATHPTITDHKPSFTHNDYGLGLHYSYAVNNNGLFIAPGLIFEQNNATAHGYGDQALQRLKIKNRYGAKIDFGFDATDMIAPYITGGYAAITHSSREYFNEDTITRTRSGTSMEWFYGAGIIFNCNKSASINIEYTTQNFRVRNSTEGSVALVSFYQTRLDILKFGISYRF